MRKTPTRRHYVKGLLDTDAISSELKEKHGIDSFHLGKRRRNGKITKETCLCCFVKEKIKLGSRDPQRVRREFKYNIGSHQKSIRTDIIASTEAITENSDITPSDIVASRESLSDNSAIRATLGAFAHTPEDGNIFITAGHFARDVGGRYATVYCHDFQGRVAPVIGTILRWKVTSRVDYAVVKPLKEADFGTGDISHTYVPALETDLDETYFVVTSSGWKPTRLLGVRSSTPTWSDMIMTEQVTKPGDSGSALVDKHNRLVGLLRGIRGNTGSYFTPIDHVMWYESFKLGGSIQ